MQNQFLIVLGQDQVDARALEIAVEQQVRIRHQNGVGRRMAGHGIDVKVAVERRTYAVNRHLGVEFAGVIQKGATEKELIFYIKFKRQSLHIIRNCVAKPSTACVG